MSIDSPAPSPCSDRPHGTGSDGDGTALDSAWFRINGVETFDPFLVSIVSDNDHWLFAASNGGLTAGRVSPQLSLFPYYTQDKLIDLAPTTGPLTRIAWQENGIRRIWKPNDPVKSEGTRIMAKRLDGTQLSFAERCEANALVFHYTWGFSQRFGFVRKATLLNEGSVARRVEILDGVRNLMPCGVSEDFQNEYSNLVDAYKRAELIEDSGLRLVYLSSVPTDRAEPSESLRATTVWTCGLAADARLLTTRQLGAFEEGAAVTTESEARGQRAACLETACLVLQPGEARSWYLVAEVGQSTAKVSRLHRYLGKTDAGVLAAELEAELERTSAELRRKVASADGLQLTRDRRRSSRHFSNVMFNIMRGGVFLGNGVIEREHLRAHLAHFNRPLAQRYAAWVDGLPERWDRDSLEAEAAAQNDPSLERLVGEYLPLTFSRRHGDPSRPWNRFAINVRDAQGRPRFAYQGNWRDIFQNWETLVHAFPVYVEGAIFRFLNATTADGYNPYRVTQDGFEWETIDPDEPWSNIGYWGDHQIIYLLRLLEASRRFHPDRLNALLKRPVFAYAQIPYRIRSYKAILEDPRVSIDYDDEAESLIARRVGENGADGRLLHTPEGGIVHVAMLEKLLVPMLAKLANFVPEGGIWMNTQRPEWNDANNALVGNGISVVTMAYCHRYVGFLLEWLRAGAGDNSHELSSAVKDWLQAQTAVFATPPPPEGMTPSARRAFLDDLGGSASVYRENLYREGLSGESSEVTTEALCAYLAGAKEWLSDSLRRSRREDGLYHSYNLLRFQPDGGIEIAHLYEMLEGQVALLSAHLLDPAEALNVMRGLRQSRLYREDQESYLLYPDRRLPRFLEKNRIDPAFAADSPLLQALKEDPDQMIVELDGDGNLRFGGTFRNADELADALCKLPAQWEELVDADRGALTAHFEEIFSHHAFTGRSGTFFAYEGLGSIYWHMVSKLVLAVQENLLSRATDEAAEPAAAREMVAFYEECLHGLGMDKNPRQYGAFPTDAYSHTPRHAGAQQPGMTGQVKEDILVRWGELGIVVEDGTIAFQPCILSAREFLHEPENFRFVDVEGRERSLLVPADALAFTFCQIPVIYRIGKRPEVRLKMANDETVRIDGSRLTPEQSQAVFLRRGTIRSIQVEVPKSDLREVFLERSYA